MYAMQGTMSVGAFMRSLGSAKAPWLTVDPRRRAGGRNIAERQDDFERRGGGQPA